MTACAVQHGVQRRSGRWGAVPARHRTRPCCNTSPRITCWRSAATSPQRVSSQTKPTCPSSSPMVASRMLSISSDVLTGLQGGGCRGRSTCIGQLEACGAAVYVQRHSELKHCHIRRSSARTTPYQRSQPPLEPAPPRPAPPHLIHAALQGQEAAVDQVCHVGTLLACHLQRMQTNSGISSLSETGSPPARPLNQQEQWRLASTACSPMKPPCQLPGWPAGA